MSTSNNNDPNNAFNNDENDFPGFDFPNSESETVSDPFADFDSGLAGGNISPDDNKTAPVNVTDNIDPETGHLNSPDELSQSPVDDSVGDSNFPPENTADLTATKDSKSKKGRKEKQRPIKPKKEKAEKVPWNINATMSLLLGFVLFACVVAVDLLVGLGKIQIVGSPVPFFVAFNICAVILLLVPFMFFRKCRFEKEVYFYDVLLGCSLILVVIACMIMICVQFMKYGTDIKATKEKLTTTPIAAPATPDPATPAPATPAPATPAPATPAPATPAPATPT